MNERYRHYYLVDNPFPADASLNMDQSDKRYNGSIFNEEICARELEELNKRLRRRTNVIYCQDTSEFMRGVGKSAIIAHTYRKLQDTGENITSVYIRSQKSRTPPLMTAQLLLSEWHRQGFLWSVLTHCLERYVEAASSPEMRLEGARLLLDRKWPVDRVDLRAYLCYNPSRLVNSLADWACVECAALSPDIAITFFENYLSKPKDFLSAYPKILRKLERDEIDMLQNLLELLSLSGFEYHYLFLDQFEDPIYGLKGKDLILFSSQMRRLLEAGIGQMSIIVTLNSSAARTLETPEAQEFTTLAPLDNRHIINVEPLEPHNASALAITYLQEFRTETPPDSLFPFTSEAVNLIHEAAEGVIRNILTGYNLCIEEGVDAKCQLITPDFLNSKYEEILGRIRPELVSLGY